MSILIGCVADDFTGATDLANTLVRAGMRTVQLLGVPRGTIESRLHRARAELRGKLKGYD